MPGTASDGPSVALSFANNFWGKDDAGVDPLLERMHSAKQTCDELKSFYAARSSLEEDYARKLLSLSRKSLGSRESGTLRLSMDTMRGEVDTMGKAHQTIAQQMKTELEEPLVAFSATMKERRKIVQNGIEKLLKAKIQQTNQVNKTRDRFEQECLKIKGYLAQGHMVMGHEERKNKAKLEKTQINVASANTEYEAAVKALEETTYRWNRDWKAAADKFQDLEEERLDFSKNSLWTFTNIISAVCVSDDACCEKIRLSLENCEVEKDIFTFIKERGTGQEIPDPPKYINFCRGDASETQSNASDDDHYSVAQFQRAINPAFRSSSPQPSTFESHHDPKSSLARELGHREPDTSSISEATITPQQAPAAQPRRESFTAQQKAAVDQARQPQPQPLPENRRVSIIAQQKAAADRAAQLDNTITPQRGLPDTVRPPQEDSQRQEPSRRQYEQPQPLQPLQPVQPARPAQPTQPAQPAQPIQPIQQDQYASVPHDPYPMDGMTMLCRTGPPSDKSSHSGLRPSRPSSPDSHRDARSDYSNPTSISSVEPLNSKQLPAKQDATNAPTDDKTTPRRRTGFFQGHSPFRRKSKHGKENQAAVPPPASHRNTWSASKSTPGFQNIPPRRPQIQGSNSENAAADRQASEEPVDPRANFQLNVGNNVFDVATPDKKAAAQPEKQEELDPIAQALAELKGATKQSSSRVSADHYSGMGTPAPESTSAPKPFSAAMGNSSTMAGIRGTPPPSYDQPASKLGLPQPAFTAKAMQQTSQKYQTQTQNLFRPGHARTESQPAYSSSSQPRPSTRETDRAISPQPLRSRSPRPGQPRPATDNNSRQSYHSASPNPYAGRPRGGSQQGFAVPPSQYAGSPRAGMPQNAAASPSQYGGSPRVPHNAGTSPSQYGGSPRAGSQQSHHHRGSQSYYGQSSPGNAARSVSPAPYAERPGSSRVGGGEIQLAPAVDDGYAAQGSWNARPSTSGNRPASSYGGQQLAVNTRQRSRTMDGRQYNRDGRPIIQFSRAQYNYTAAIPEELSFAKGDILAIMRFQDDGWWEAEVAGKNQRPGLVPSNYLMAV